MSAHPDVVENAIVQSNSDQRHRNIVLLDVDGLLLLNDDTKGKPIYHDKLIQKIATLRYLPNVEFRLHTNMTLPRGLPTRQALITYLDQKYGIEIKAVHTPADVGYGKGLGAAFKAAEKGAFTNYSRDDVQKMQDAAKGYHVRVAKSNDLAFDSYGKLDYTNNVVLPAYWLIEIKAKSLGEGKPLTFEYCFRTKDNTLCKGEMNFDELALEETITDLERDLPKYEKALLTFIKTKHKADLPEAPANALPIELHQQLRDNPDFEVTKGTLFYHAMTELNKQGESSAILYLDDATSPINSAAFLAPQFGLMEAGKTVPIARPQSANYQREQAKISAKDFMQSWLALDSSLYLGWFPGKSNFTANDSEAADELIAAFRYQIITQVSETEQAECRSSSSKESSRHAQPKRIVLLDVDGLLSVGMSNSSYNDALIKLLTPLKSLSNIEFRLHINTTLPRSFKHLQNVVNYLNKQYDIKITAVHTPADAGYGKGGLGGAFEAAGRGEFKQFNNDQIQEIQDAVKGYTIRVIKENEFNQYGKNAEAYVGNSSSGGSQQFQSQTMLPAHWTIFLKDSITDGKFEYLFRSKDGKTHKDQITLNELELGENIKHSDITDVAKDRTKYEKALLQKIQEKHKASLPEEKGEIWPIELRTEITGSRDFETTKGAMFFYAYTKLSEVKTTPPLVMYWNDVDTVINAAAWVSRSLGLVGNHIPLACVKPSEKQGDNVKNSADAFAESWCSLNPKVFLGWFPNKENFTPQDGRAAELLTSAFADDLSVIRDLRAMPFVDESSSSIPAYLPIPLDEIFGCAVDSDKSTQLQEEFKSAVRYELNDEGEVQNIQVNDFDCLFDAALKGLASSLFVLAQLALKDDVHPNIPYDPISAYCLAQLALMRATTGQGRYMVRGFIEKHFSGDSFKEKLLREEPNPHFKSLDELRFKDIYELSQPSVRLETVNSPSHKITAFDRDETLTERKNHQVINKLFFKPVMTHIVLNPEERHWTSVTRGIGGEFRTHQTNRQLEKWKLKGITQDQGSDEDNNFASFRSEVLEDGFQSKNQGTTVTPGKSNYSYSTDYVGEVEKLFKLSRSEQTIKWGSFNRKGRVNLFSNPASIFARFPQTKEEHELFPKILRNGKTTKINGELYLMYEDTPYLVGRYMLLPLANGITYLIELETFLAYIEEQDKSDIKPFQILASIVKGYYAVIPDEAMKKAGIIAVYGHAGVKTIAPSQVMGLDDHQTQIDAWELVGFKAALADSEIAVKRHAVNRLSEMLSSMASQEDGADNITITALEKQDFFKITFRNSRSQFKEQTLEFHVDDKVTFTQGKGAFEITVKEFCEQEQAKRGEASEEAPYQDNIKINDVKLAQHDSRRYDTYEEPLRQHLGFSNAQKLEADNLRQQLFLHFLMCKINNVIHSALQGSSSFTSFFDSQKDKRDCDYNNYKEQIFISKNIDDLREVVYQVRRDYGKYMGGRLTALHRQQLATILGYTSASLLQVLDSYNKSGTGSEQQKTQGTILSDLTTQQLKAFVTEYEQYKIAHSSAYASEGNVSANPNAMMSSSSSSSSSVSSSSHLSGGDSDFSQNRYTTLSLSSSNATNSSSQIQILIREASSTLTQGGKSALIDKGVGFLKLVRAYQLCMKASLAVLDESRVNVRELMRTHFSGEIKQAAADTSVLRFVNDRYVQSGDDSDKVRGLISDIGGKSSNVTLLTLKTELETNAFSVGMGLLT